MRPLVKGGYGVIEIPLQIRGHAVHALYVKAHSSASNGGEKTKTLFVGNVDLVKDMSPEDIDGYLRELFGPFGSIESVSVSSFDELQERSAPSRFSHVTFLKASSVKSILNAVQNCLFASSVPQITARWGLANALAVKSSKELRSSFPFVDEDRADLKRKVDQYMVEFEELEQVARLDRERASRQVDEEGFMPVQHRKKRKRQSEGGGGGRKGGSSSGTVGRARSNKKKTTPITSADLHGGAGAEVGGEQGGEKTLKNFYAFQQRQEKQSTLLKLREQFEEDKRKIAQLKAQRKFKPF